MHEFTVSKAYSISRFYQCVSVSQNLVVDVGLWRTEREREGEREREREREREERREITLCS